MNAFLKQAEFLPQMALAVDSPEFHLRSPEDTVPSERCDRVAKALVAMGAGVVFDRLIRQLDFIQLAEREIEAAVQRHPDRETQLKNAFRYLAWMNHVQPGDEVYRAHAREILERVAVRQDLRPGTWAEALVVLSEASLQSPLNQTAIATMFVACEKVFGQAPMALYVHEPENGEVTKLLKTLFTTTAKERDVSKICHLT